MYEYYTTMNYSQSNNNYNNVPAISSYPLLEYNAYKEAYKMMGNLFTSVAKIFSR